MGDKPGHILKIVTVQTWRFIEKVLFTPLDGSAGLHSWWGCQAQSLLLLSSLRFSMAVQGLWQWFTPF